MKKALLVVLVVIVVMTGLPVLMGMGGAMSSCTDCGPGLPGSAPCLPAVLAAGLLLFALVMSSRVGGRARAFPHWLLTRPFERPPQLV